MKIKEILIKNYEVIRELELKDLGDLVVIAGPNGVGKTKLKDAIVYIFQNGNPPPGCSVILEATNEEELKNWGTETVALPNQSFLNYFRRSRRKIKTDSRLIHVDSSRQIDSFNFQQYTFHQLGEPLKEEVGYDYGLRRSRDRFSDIAQTLYKEKAKMIAELGKSAYQQLQQGGTDQATVNRVEDFTKEFEEIFGRLLYPKKMAPIETDTPTIQFFDVDGNIRNFGELSSGEQAVIILAFDILLQKPSDSIILIDEPELHLHPELSFRLMKVLNSIGKRNQFFLFTHSVDIIGSSLENGVHFLRPKNLTTDNQALKVDHSNLLELNLMPNLREAIGMLSLGKKLLFVEGKGTSIDRNVFATLAKSAKIDLAIVPSESCHHVKNMSMVAETLSKGLFGIELFMVRDRDSVTEAEVTIYEEKSKGHLMFLPFYCIENTFLDVKALAALSEEIGVKKTSEHEVEQKLIELAKLQINSCVAKYVASEFRFKAATFDLSTDSISSSDTLDKVIAELKARKNDGLRKYEADLSDEYLEERTKYWHEVLEKSVKSNWSKEAQAFFLGKPLLAQISEYLFPGKKIVVWQQMINSENAECKRILAPLMEVLGKV